MSLSKCLENKKTYILNGDHLTMSKGEEIHKQQTSLTLGVTESKGLFRYINTTTLSADH